MANKADVYVKNVLTDEINVLRKLPDGSSDLEIAIATGNEDMVHLPGTEVSLLINAPVGMDTKDCPINMVSDVDLSVSCSRTDSNWILQIVPNELPPDAPTTVNVTCGDEE